MRKLRVRGGILLFTAAALFGCGSKDTQEKVIAVPDQFRVLAGKQISPSPVSSGGVDNGYRIALIRGSGLVFEYSSIGAYGGEVSGHHVVFAVPSEAKRFNFDDARLKDGNVFLVQSGFISKPTRKGMGGFIRGSAVSDSCWHVDAEVRWKPALEDSSDIRTRISDKFCLAPET